MIGSTTKHIYLWFKLNSIPGNINNIYSSARALRPCLFGYVRLGSTLFKMPLTNVTPKRATNTTPPSGSFLLVLHGNDTDTDHSPGCPAGCVTCSTDDDLTTTCNTGGCTAVGYAQIPTSVCLGRSTAHNR